MSTMPHSSPEAANTNIPTSVLRLAEHRLDVAVRDFEAVAASFGAPMPASDELLKLTRQVAALTTELFRGEFTVEIDVDPEIRGDICLLFQVTASGSVEAIAALDQQWHRRVTSIALKWPGLFSLSIDAR
jgi:hypothetical protein